MLAASPEDQFYLEKKKLECSYICNDSENSEKSEDWVPDSNILCPLWNRSLRVLDVFGCVDSDFKNVVQESEEGRERKCAGEEHCEAKLDCELDVIL